ncbi:hypothetical protein C2E23DRAFT_883223 [Lenzites betulinus]|nr:hypothetical protein C2E23DRAFT_883223 [Lenzites betulinus]
MVSGSPTPWNADIKALVVGEVYKPAPSHLLDSESFYAPMPSFRAALAFAVLVSAILCGATPLTNSPAVALSHHAEILTNTTIASSEALSARSDDSATLVACTDKACKQGCVRVLLDSIPHNQCRSISNGKGFASAWIDQHSQKGLNYAVPLTTKKDCSGSSATLPIVQGCGVLPFAVSSFKLVSGKTSPP